VGPDNVPLSAHPKKLGAGYELRVVEVEDRRATARVELAPPIAQAADRLRKKGGEVSRRLQVRRFGDL